MAGTKEIRTKIQSVAEHAQDHQGDGDGRRLRRCARRRSACATRVPYGEKIRNIAAHLAHANPEYQHPPLVQARRREEHRRSSSSPPTRACAGRLNTNVLRLVRGTGGGESGSRVQDRSFTRDRQQGPRLRCSVCGANVVSQVVRCRRPARAARQADRPGEGAGRCVPRRATHRRGSTSCYTRFINTMKQEPVIEQLLPLPAERLPDARAQRRTGTTSTSPTRGSCSTSCCARYLEADHLPGARREHRERAVGAHGGDEGRQRQRQRADRRAHAGLTTRRGRRRSPRNSPKSSAAQRAV